MTLFRRQYRVTVDTIEIRDLDIRFDIVKTLKKEPNTCELTVFNLNPEHRLQLKQLEKPLVTIEAGYGDDIGQIFRGRCREIRSFKEGPDWLTEINSGDGGDELATARVNQSYAAGTPLRVPIKKLAEQMKVGIGNAAKKALEGDFSGAANEALNSLVLSGRASTEMDGLLKSAGLEWSVQDNELQLIKIGDVLEGLAVRLAIDTGLIGSPTVGNDNITQVRSLMNPLIFPGRKLEIEAIEVDKGFYKAGRCEYLGDTAGDDWFVDVEAKLAA